MIQEIIETIVFTISNPVALVLLIGLLAISFKWRAKEPKILLFGLTLASGLSLWVTQQLSAGTLNPAWAIEYYKLSFGWANAKMVNFLGIRLLDLAGFFAVVAQLVKDRRTGFFGFVMFLSILCGIVWLAAFSGYLSIR